MRIESHPEVLLDEAGEAFGNALDDVHALAQQNARRYSKSGKFEQSITVTDVAEQDGRLTARVGSPLVSAAAKERGAYIVPKSGKWLTFMGRDGHLVKVAAVRLPKRPVVIPAGRRFPELMLERLRELRG